mmetsp:Transcript_23860/g.64451  ORF Transcript_23860/g.64451 Transcript_23860/m.64451 type:complete len:265 (-) Transcript_23860:167-961(-)
MEPDQLFRQLQRRLQLSLGTGLVFRVLEPQPFCLLLRLPLTVSLERPLELKVLLLPELLAVLPALLLLLDLRQVPSVPLHRLIEPFNQRRTTHHALDPLEAVRAIRVPAQEHRHEGKPRALDRFAHDERLTVLQGPAPDYKVLVDEGLALSRRQRLPTKPRRILMQRRVQVYEQELRLGRRELHCLLVAVHDERRVHLPVLALKPVHERLCCAWAERDWPAWPEQEAQGPAEHAHRPAARLPLSFCDLPRLGRRRCPSGGRRRL